MSTTIAKDKKTKKFSVYVHKNERVLCNKIKESEKSIAANTGRNFEDFHKHNAKILKSFK